MKHRMNGGGTVKVGWVHLVGLRRIWSVSVSNVDRDGPALGAVRVLVDLDGSGAPGGAP